MSFHGCRTVSQVVLLPQRGRQRKICLSFPPLVRPKFFVGLASLNVGFIWECGIFILSKVNLSKWLEQCCCCCCCCFLGFLLMFTADRCFQGVGDGICDCCDGSDEWQRPNSCRNVCAEQGRERKAIQDLLHFTFQFVPFEHCYWLF